MRHADILRLFAFCFLGSLAWFVVDGMIDEGRLGTLEMGTEIWLGIFRVWQFSEYRNFRRVDI